MLPPTPTRRGVIVDMRVIAMNDISYLPRSSEIEIHQQRLFSVIPRTPVSVFGGVPQGIHAYWKLDGQDILFFRERGS